MRKIIATGELRFRPTPGPQVLLQPDPSALSQLQIQYMYNNTAADTDTERRAESFTQRAEIERSDPLGLAFLESQLSIGRPR